MIAKSVDGEKWVLEKPAVRSLKADKDADWMCGKKRDSGDAVELEVECSAATERRWMRNASQRFAHL